MLDKLELPNVGELLEGAPDFLSECNEADFKRIGKKLKEVIKDLRNGRQRSFYLTEYVPIDKVVAFAQLQNKYFKLMFEYENARATEFLNDKENLYVHGLFRDEDFESGGCFFGREKKTFSKSQQAELLQAWAEEAYPDIDYGLWDLQFEQAVYVKYIKS